MRQKYFLRHPVYIHPEFDNRQPLFALRFDVGAHEMMVVGSYIFKKKLDEIAKLVEEVSDKKKKCTPSRNSWRYRIIVRGVEELDFEAVKEELVRLQWFLEPTSSFNRLSS